jgi:hypothetical protein
MRHADSRLGFCGKTEDAADRKGVCDALVGKRRVHRSRRRATTGVTNETEASTNGPSAPTGLADVIVAIWVRGP